MRKRDENKIPGKLGEVLLLYSGGLDTTLEVIGLAQHHERVHLLTFNNGYCVNLRSAARSAGVLRDQLGLNVVHSFVSLRPWIKRSRPGLRKLWGKYHSPLVVDMLCKAGSLAAVIEYALLNNVTDYSDGSSKDQTQIFIQHPRFRRYIRPCAEEFGLRYIEPCYAQLSRKEKFARLAALGFPPEKKWLEKLHITSRLSQQPFCLVGLCTYFFTSPLRNLPFVEPLGLSLERAERLWDEIWPGIRRDLLDRFYGNKQGLTAGQVGTGNLVPRQK